MSYALVLDGQLVAVRYPGRTEPKLADGRPLSAPDGIWTPDLAALCGFVEIVETTRPADTDTQTTDYSVALVGGIPTVVWTTRDKTVEEMTPPPPTADERLDAARLALSEIDTLTAPVLPVDVLDVLTDVRTALEG